MTELQPYTEAQSKVLLEPSPSYTENHTQIIAKHANELFPTPLTPPQVTVVFKASRELMNGHLGRQLALLAKQSTSNARFEAIVVVNNPRYYEAFSRVSANDETVSIPDALSEIRAEDPSDTRSKNDILAEWMQTHDVSTEVSIYRENLVTLQILQTISHAVTRLQAGMREEEELAEIRDTIQQVEALCPETMTSSIRVQLLEGTRAILKSKVMVMGLDCMSMDKGFPNINLAGAMDEGAHIALERGSKYLDFRDMDEFPRGRNSLTEILSDTAVENGPDILIRPMRLDVFHHPEEMEASDDIYTRILLDYVNKIKYLPFYAGTESLFGYSNGRILCSSRLYKASPYSEHVRQPMEDYTFSKSLIALAKKYGLSVGYLVSPDSYLTLDNSAKKGSLMDSGRTADGITMERIREDMWYIMRPIGKATVEIEQLLQSLSAEDSVNADKYRLLLDDYHQARERFFAVEQAGRRKIRDIFFGISGSDDNPGMTVQEHHGEERSHTEGVVQKLLRQISLDELFVMTPQEQDSVLQNTVNNIDLSNSVRIYLEQNPLLLKGILQQMKQHDLRSAKQLLSFLEASTPELFARPLRELPDIHLLSDRETLINMTDWMPIFYANQYLVGRLLNDNTFDPEVVKELTILGNMRGSGKPLWEEPNES